MFSQSSLLEVKGRRTNLQKSKKYMAGPKKAWVTYVFNSALYSCAYFLVHKEWCLGLLLAFPCVIEESVAFSGCSLIRIGHVDKLGFEEKLCFEHLGPYFSDQKHSMSLRWYVNRSCCTFLKQD